jgi:hypothetical protein
MSKSLYHIIISLVLLSILLIPAWGQTRVGKFGVGVEGSGQFLMGAGSFTPSLGLGGGVSMSYSIMEYLGLRGKFSTNQISWAISGGPVIKTDLMSLSLYLSGDLMPNSTINPFVIAGGGMIFFDPKFDDGTPAAVSSGDMNFIGGAGVDYFLNEFWSITLMGEYVITGSPYYAGSSIAAAGNDSFLRGSLQIRYYFFDQAFITRLLDAQRERSKRGK